jgi:FtsP/CotA-like multicopper oxidase with cupredoxin domain
MPSRHLFLITGLAVLTACAQDSEPQQAAEPGWSLPALEGPVATLEDLNPDPDIVEVELWAGHSNQTLYTNERGDPVIVPMMTYNGVFPGPTLQAKMGDQVIVHFTNELDEPTTVHWHGLRISDEMDGNPRIVTPVQPGETFVYHFTVNDPGSYWYHPHVRGHEQLERGLVGTLTVHDPADPVYDGERFLVFDDILLDGNGRHRPFLGSHPELMHGRSGNILLTNGSADPPIATARQGTLERWRLVNTANARTFDLIIKGARAWVIGTDGGLLGEENIFYARDIELPVGQRYDLEIAFEEAGTVEVIGRFRTLDQGGNPTTIEIPLYRVEVRASDLSSEVGSLQPAVTRPSRPVTRQVTMEFGAREGGEHGIEWLINGQAHHMGEPLFTFDEGDVVLIDLINLAGPEHPFHLHGQFFEIVDDGRSITRFPGLKDTVLLPGRESLQIKAYMDNPGQWMAHCHIGAHAELGMMAEILVRPAR